MAPRRPPLMEASAEAATVTTGGLATAAAAELRSGVIGAEGEATASAASAEAEGSTGSGPRIHSVYGDVTQVYEGQQPPRLGQPIPDPEAGGPYIRLRWDTVNGRVYQVREFDDFGYPVRDIDFTAPTYPNGVIRPGHWIPEEHLWSVNDPDVGPASGWVPRCWSSILANEAFDSRMA